MGGAVSSGRDNNELVDNLMSGSYIRSRAVERVFRVLDRADYMSAEARDQAYKDLAWRNGPLHLSAPCIYSEVMEALDLKPGLSFLNVGSGTGYLSTLVGLIIGSSGTSHGVEALPAVFEYANTKLTQFIENSITLDEFDFCMPKYYTANGLCLAPTHAYDRVYCGAGVLAKYENYFKQFIKVGGVLVMPLADTLVQLRRVSDTHWIKRNLLNVSFALLRDPNKAELEDLVKLDEQSPAPLQVLSRRAIRGAMRAGLMRRHPELREPPPPPPPVPRAAPRRICIPYDEASDEELNELHDLDEAGGAHEMNALLSLVLSMGQNRAAGSLRLDPAGDDHLGDEYAEVGGLYALDDQAGEEPPLLPAGGVIVFDMGGGARAGRRRARARSHDAAPPPASTSAAATLSDSEALAQPRPSDPHTRAIVSVGAAINVRTAETSTQTGTSTDDLGTDSVDQNADGPPDPDGGSEADAAGSESGREMPAPAAKELLRIPRTRTLTRVMNRHLPPRMPLPRPPWTDSSSEDDDTAQVKESKRQKLDSGIGEGTASSGASPDKSDHSTASESSRTADDEEQDTDMPWCDDDEGDSGTSGSTEDSEGDADSDEEDGDDNVDEGGDDDGDDGDDGGDNRGEGRDVEMAAGEEDKTRSELKRKNINRSVGRRACGSTAHTQMRKRNTEAAPRRRQEARARSAGSDSGMEASPPPRRAPPQRDARRVSLSLAMKRGVKELPLPHALKKFVNYGRCYQF